MRAKWQEVWESRWLVLGVAILVQVCDGVGYAFASYSPVIKSALGYSQQQLSGLGVAKDIGDSVGLLAGTLCDFLPLWGLFLVGASMNLIGYGILWLTVSGQIPVAPFEVMCVVICLATNGETFLNTGVLVACVRNFPHHRGGTVGILKGFTGLSGAIFTQLYTCFLAPNMASFIFLVAVGPFMVTIFAMFIVRPIPPTLGNAHQDDSTFKFIYGVCIAIAAYLLGLMVLQDVIDVGKTFQVWLAFGLMILLLLPLVFPISRILFRSKSQEKEEQAPLLPEVKPQDGRDAGGENRPPAPIQEFTDFSEMEDEKTRDLPERVRRARLKSLRAKMFRAVAEGAIKVRRRKGPRRGEDFTLSQALVKADFWLLFFVLLCGGGSALTVIDNLGQVGESQGYANAHTFVSLLSVSSYLGRFGAGWVSEIIARDYITPRPILLAGAQGLMAIGHFILAFGMPFSMYFGSVLIGFGYGCHWSVIPATASELFGLKNFGALYNVLTTSLPTGSLLFSGLIAGPLYDREAARQQKGTIVFGASESSLVCKGAVCFKVTFILMSLTCLVGIILDTILVKRTYRVYQTLYGKNPAKSAPVPAIAPAAPPSLLSAVIEEKEEEEAASASSSH